MTKPLSIPEACQIIGIGRTKIYQLINSGQLPAKKLGMKTVILSDDIQAFLNALDNYSVKEGGA